MSTRHYLGVEETIECIKSERIHLGSSSNRELGKSLYWHPYDKKFVLSLIDHLAAEYKDLTFNSVEDAVKKYNEVKC